MKKLSIAAQANLMAAAKNSTRVSGLTHGFYKYPARFSPSFARVAIEIFTQPGDLVVDNHVGGGTTLVEALALGRHAIGIDISTLAQFVATVKTTILTQAELKHLTDWANTFRQVVNVHKPSAKLAAHAELGYYKHLDHRNRWRLRKAIEQSIASAMLLGSSSLEAFGRCVVLRTAQWALDGRRKRPSVREFREQLKENALGMIEGARALALAVESSPNRSKVTVLNRSSVGIENDDSITRHPAPRLVLTSPPYPGVHVLYHRWQVDGRKESPLPFMIADKLDGAAESFYTMGGRKSPELKIYFDSVRATMASVAAIADQHTIVVQMLAFSEPEWQLPKYITAMQNAGLMEIFLPSLNGIGDGRLWRSVPSRRWYSEQRGETPASREVVLFHRKYILSQEHLVRTKPLVEASLVTSDTLEQ